MKPARATTPQSAGSGARPRPRRRANTSFSLVRNHRVRPGGVILVYHRVADLPTDPLLLAVSPSNFNSHLRILRDEAQVVDLQWMLGVTSGVNEAKNTVAVTFDDGYEDNLTEALPSLTRYEVPATCFVTVEALDEESEFMWDDLERLILVPEKLPPHLEISLGEEVLRWSSRDEVQSSRPPSSWHVLTREVPSSRHALYLRLLSTMTPLPAAARRKALDDIEAWAGVDARPRDSHRPLSWQGLRRLAQGGLVEIGAHSVTHPQLATLSFEDQRKEIEGSKKRLEEETNREVTSFSYPYGDPEDFTETTRKAVREAGFQVACANTPGHVIKDVDCFALPRFLVRNWPAEEFAARLRGFMSGRWRWPW